jgi:hypothetical protein
MANKSYRIKTGINEDKYVSVNLKQGVHMLNILSLNINTEDGYYVHNSNYGVIVGRVLANDSFGVPNVKVSVFIPITEDDYNDDILSNIYPFTTLQSIDNDGVRYNLVQNKDSDSIGTFPNKRFVLDNDGEVEIFDKYWKYTTVTNQSGDYMLFGIPTGNCQVHYDCDLSDIGMISQKPYDFINKGYSASLFKSPTEFLDDDLNSAIHILSQDKSVYVWPFWGDESNNDTSDTNNVIGITRNDINLDYTFEPSCIFMGSSITDSDGTYIGIYGNPNGNTGKFNSLSTSTGDIEIIRKTIDGRVEALKENVQGIIDGNGVWCYQIPMNLDRIGMDEEGNIIAINNPNKGIPTRARVRFRITLTSANNESTGEYAVKMLVPNNPKLKGVNNSSSVSQPMIDSSYVTDSDWDKFYEFGTETPDCCFRDLYYGKIYSVKEYYPRFQYGLRSPYHTTKDEYSYSYKGYPYGYAMPFSCISSIDRGGSTNAFPYNTMYSGAEHKNDSKTKEWFDENLVYDSLVESYPSKGLQFCFENDWINGCLYFPRVLIKYSTTDGTYRFFGSEDSYSDGSVYISGRHNIKYENGIFGVKDIESNKWDKDEEKGTESGSSNVNTTYYSVIKLNTGIVKMTKNRLGSNVFYYSCGGKTLSSEVFQRLYATDIILLGNIDNIYDNLPNLADKLPSTTCIFPPIGVPDTFNEAGMNMCSTHEQLKQMYHKESDNDNVDIFASVDKIEEDNYKKSKDAEKFYKYCCDSWTNSGIKENEKNCRASLLRSSLFFGYKVKEAQDFLCYFPDSFANLSRICELDVQNDHSFYRHGELYPINGIIDGFDIINDENRSMFASMNYNITDYYIETGTNRRKYLFTPLYLTCFEGRLGSYCSDNYLSGVGPYKEYTDKSYVMFRYGRNGTLQYNGITSTNIEGCNFSKYGGKLFLTENSLYFYFGLRAGMSAIDVYRTKYYSSNDENGESSTESDEGANIISYEILNSDSCYSEKDGVLYSICSFNISSILTTPITYSLSDYSGKVVATGKTDNDSYDFTVDNVPSGQITISVSGANNYTASRSFYISSDILSIDYSLVSGQYNGFTINKINGYSIKKCERIDSVGQNFSASVENDTYTIIFENARAEQASNDERTFYFQSFVDRVDVKILLGNCIKYYKTIYLIVSSESSGSLDEIRAINKMPLKYIANYPNSSANTEDINANSLVFPSEYGQFITYSGDNITVDVYNFSSVNKDQGIQYMSYMMQALFGYSDMNVSTFSNSDDCEPVIIFPSTLSFSGTTQMTADEAWNFQAKAENVQVLKLSSDKTSVDAENEIYLPHLVGSNYPTGYNKNSNVKTHKRGDNESGYIENESLKNVNGQSAAYNAVAFIKKSESGEDSPVDGVSPRKTGMSFQPNDVVNYYKIKTVDKRMDYEFCLLTPLLLPSGYDKYNITDGNLAINKGSYSIAIYGGIRFDYDSNGKQTSYAYDENTGKIYNSPTHLAVLYNWDINESYNKISVSGKNILEYGGVNEETLSVGSINRNPNVNGEGIDVVSYNISNALSGNDAFHVSLTDCSPVLMSFNDVVTPGNSLNFNISYKSGIKIKDKSDTISYDILYTYNESDNSYYGSFEGSSLEFNIANDELYSGKTYTDVYYKGSHYSSNESDTEYPYMFNIFANRERKNEISILRYGASGKTVGIYQEYSVYPRITNSNVNIDANEDSKYYVYNNNGDFVPDSPISGIGFALNSNSNKFGAYDYITIPTRKLYQEETYNQLKQGMVFNSGYIYYASKITTTLSHNCLYVQLTSPIVDNSKYNTDGTVTISSLTKDAYQIHQIGEIEKCWLPNDSRGDYMIIFRYSNCRFVISPVSDEKSIQDLLDEYGENEFPFYFKIKNGMQYKVNIELNRLKA